MITCRVTGTKQNSAYLPQGAWRFTVNCASKGTAKIFIRLKSSCNMLDTRTTGMDAKEARKQSTVTISRSPKIFVCISDSLNSSVKVEKSQNSLDTIINSLCSVKMDKSPSWSITVNVSASSHIQVIDSDCSVINVSVCSSSFKEVSESSTVNVKAIT